MNYYGMRTAPEVVPSRAMASDLNSQFKGLFVSPGQSPMAAGSPTQLLEQLFAANRSLQASSKSQSQELKAFAARAAATSAFAETAAAVGGSAATPLATPISLPQYGESHLFACEGDSQGLLEVLEDFEDQPHSNDDSYLTPFSQPDHLGNSPLHYACEEFRNITAVRVLLENGSPVDAQNFEGKTPLHQAVSNSENDLIADLLIKFGANVNIADADGATALHAAAANGCLQICELLVCAGAWVDSADCEGDTPLMYAVREDLDEVVAFLVAAGANPHLQNEDGESPVDAAQLSTFEVLSALRR